MSRLDNVIKGSHDAPYRIVLYGERGLGKTSFASEAPNPIFLFGEEGQGNLDLSIMPTKDNGRIFRGWGDLMDALRELFRDPRHYKTVVIDTIDALWTPLFAFVCEKKKTRNGKVATSIEDYGYGIGFQYADDALCHLLQALDSLVEQKGLNAIILAHSITKNVDPPDGEPYSQYRLPGNDRLANRVADWGGALLFAQCETAVRNAGGGGKNKAVSRGDRILHTEYHPAHWSKNRLDLPAELPMPKGKAWATFDAAAKKGKKLASKRKQTQSTEPTTKKTEVSTNG